MGQITRKLKVLGFTAVSIPLTQCKWTIIDIDDAPEVLSYRWFAKKHRSAGKESWYASRSIFVGPTQDKITTMRLHQLLLPVMGELTPDHKNGDTLDNRRQNLRLASRTGNNANRRMSKSFASKTGYRGVSRCKKGRYYRAHLSWMGKIYFKGTYKDPRRAALAYDEMATRIQGEFAVTNKSLGLL